MKKYSPVWREEQNRVDEFSYRFTMLFVRAVTCCFNNYTFKTVKCCDKHATETGVAIP